MTQNFNRIMVPILLLIFLTILPGCTNKANENYYASNTQQIILRLAETQTPAYPSSRGAQEFARLVEQKSAGRIKVRVYDSGKLGNETSVIEQVQFGGIDLARVSLASLAKYSPKVNIATLPYIFRNSEHMWKVLDGPMGEDIKESLLREKITCLTWYEGGAKGFYATKRRINNTEDLMGLKINVQQSQMIMDLYSQIGISLVPTRQNDLYSSLQAGSIDGAEDNIITYYISKHYEIAPYFTDDKHTRIPEVIIGSRITLLQLTKEDRLILEAAAKESAVMQKQLWSATEEIAYQTLKDIGVQIITDVNKDSLLSIAQPLYDTFSKGDLDTIVYSR